MIERLDSRPDESQPGFQSMCSYLVDSVGMRARVESFRPLLGRPLGEALFWQPDVNQAGCLCMQDNRNHKWLMALQTVHFALAQIDG